MPGGKKRILIADPSLELLKSLKKNTKAEKFTIEIAQTGAECLEKIKTFEPELLIVDLMLPGMHGLEILKATKNNQSMKKIGVILTSFHPMVQNHHSAIKSGALYFLEKPFTATSLFHLIRLFFEGTLSPAPFPQKKPEPHYKAPPTPPPKIPTYLKLWGTRGSNPVAGSEYVRFGGNTPCLEVRTADTLVIIDAGSGIRGLGHILHDHQEKRMDILLSHTHWDHLLGFPFFYPIYQPGREVHIWSPVGFEKSTKELFSDMLAYAYFPVGLDDIRSSIFFHDLRDEQSANFGNIRISSHYSFHPGPTLCFKIEMNGKKIGYVTDNEFLMGNYLPARQAEKKSSLFEPYESLIAFLSDCDLLIHEAQYTDEEYLDKEGWGHSSITNASILVKKAGIKKWIITHHDPKHTDEELLGKYEYHHRVMEELNHECLIQLAYDGMMIAVD